MPGDKATFLDYCEQRGVDFATASDGSGAFRNRVQRYARHGRRISGAQVPACTTGAFVYTFSGSMCSGYLAGRSAASEAGAVPDLDGLEAEIECRARPGLPHLWPRAGTPCRKRCLKPRSGRSCPTTWGSSANGKWDGSRAGAPCLHSFVRQTSLSASKHARTDACP